MNNFFRSKISHAVALAMGTVLAAGSTAVIADDISDSPNAGSALMFPYYTVRDGWSSLYNITNLVDATVAMKIRFRESYNSRDVLDFNVIMSPKDVWTAWVAEGPNGPRLYTRDNTCTSPLMETDANGAKYFDFTDVGYSGQFADGGPTGIDRAREGHLEVISMGFQEESGIEGDTVTMPAVYYAKHVDGVPRDCAKVDAEFVAQNKNFDPETNPNGDPDAADYFDGPDGSDTQGFEDYLKGNFSLVNVDRGVGAGGEAVAWEEFGPSASGDENLITAQEYPFFLEPSLASDSGLWEWDVWNTSDDFDTDAVQNEWSINENLGVLTDWVISLPTKNLHVDIDDHPQAGVNPDRFRYSNPASAETNTVMEICNKDGLTWRCDCDSDRSTSGDGSNGFEVTGKDSFRDAVLACANATIEPDENSTYRFYPVAPFENPFEDGKSCTTVAYELYDREEGGVRSGGTSISPAPPIPKDSICYETNVVTFGGAESTLGSTLAQTVAIDGLTSGAKAGWLNLDWEGFDSNVVESSAEITYTGIPAIGFALKTRDFGNPSLSFGQLHEHSYAPDDWDFD